MRDGHDRGRMCRGYPACHSCPGEAQRPCMSVSGCGRDQRLTLPPRGVQLVAQGGEAAEAAMHGRCTREPVTQPLDVYLLDILRVGPSLYLPWSCFTGC